MMVGWSLLIVIKEKFRIIDLDIVENQNIIISNIYFIDCHKYNLLSASRLCDMSYYVKFDAKIYYLIRYLDDDLVYTDERKKKVYYLSFDHFKHYELYLNATTSNS
jgi:hypothetical protein